ncbi:hypothetical protein E2542_SST11204 [Spatholobus suberectus]|nr:hypothetical protein E2542_SST11204 [Spatholobus suberectus]
MVIATGKDGATVVTTTEPLTLPSCLPMEILSLSLFLCIWLTLRSGQGCEAVILCSFSGKRIDFWSYNFRVDSELWQKAI